MAKLLKVSDEIHNWVMSNRTSEMGFTCNHVLKTLIKEHENSTK